MKQPNIHKYEADVSQIKKECILCRRDITDEEFEYEDYYIAFRGFTPNVVRGFICFNCVSEEMPIKRGECPYCHKRLAHVQRK